MCTVTYIPKGNSNFILTSNRDEAIGRTTLVPDFYTVDGIKMLFPKDAVAGGSWIGISEKNSMICLLNGGFENHIRVENYKMSRGVVVKELLKADDLSAAINAFNYNGIEPFTIIAIDWSSGLKATELVWDGYKAHITVLPDTPKIWSSSTLYDATMKQKRRDWFGTFLNKDAFEEKDLYRFHTTAGEGDKNVDVCMDRGLLKTVSITQVEKTADDCVMTYYDLQKDEVHRTEFDTVTV
ncbi:NRDE family protein [uncultured Dokdonia sp.]|uniref:NRDE family protein n=1 Tax=uncultured Dokdonia sp. TaxID=575653 RepID=UPI002626D8AD|nr:NRDE family protein [uncultured Dokdonia sp.]